MTHVFDVLIRALPLFLMISLGAVIRKTGVLSEKSIPEIKNLIVNITLPSMLLITFAKTDFKLIYAGFAAIIFAFCCLMLGVGMIIGKKMGGGNRFYPALFTGFEAGMMGYALFATFFAEENRFAFAIVDIGQVLFVFFILTMFLRKISDTRASAGSLVKKVLISPIILAIVIGIVLGAFGFYRDLSVFPVTGRIEETLNLLGALTQPLICIVIGFELRFRFSNIQRPLTAIFLRLPIMLVSAYAINTLVVDRLLQLDPIFHLAVYTMFLLPPPFVIPIYLRSATETEKGEILDTLSLHVIVSLIVFMVLQAVTK